MRFESNRERWCEDCQRATVHIVVMYEDGEIVAFCGECPED